MIHSLARTRRAGLTAAIAVALVPAASLAQAPVTADILLEVNRYEVEGDNPISAGETEEALRPHLGRHRDVSSLEAAAEGLEKRIRDRGFAFHRVIVPAQKPSGGVVKL